MPVQRIRDAGPEQRDRRCRREVRGAAIEQAAVQVQDVREQGIRLFALVAQQNGVGPDPGESADRPRRVPVRRGDVAGSEHVRSDSRPGRRRWPRVQRSGRHKPHQHVRIPEPVHGRLETEEALLLRESPRLAKTETCTATGPTGSRSHNTYYIIYDKDNAWLY